MVLQTEQLYILETGFLAKQKIKMDQQIQFHMTNFGLINGQTA